MAEDGSADAPSGDPPDGVAAAPLLEVGRIGRAHGMRGELVVHLVTNRVERLAPGSVLATPTRELRVEKSRPLGANWVVAFAGVPDRSAAEGLVGLVISAAPIEDPDALWVHELVGAEVLLDGGEAVGTVVGVVANPASDLLELDGGALVPLRFVVSVKREEARGDEPARIAQVVVDVPLGLIE